MNWDEGFISAQKYLRKGLFHAANAIFHNLEERCSEQPDSNRLGELFNALGKIYLSKIPDYKEAINCFTKAIENTDNKEARVKYTINLGMAYRKMSEFDTCYRYLTSLTDDLDGVSDGTKGVLFANLSAIQGINGFYEQAIASIDESSKAFADADNPINEAALHNNKGLAYLELGVYDKAEFHLNMALQLEDDDHLEALTELGRLNLLWGRIRESIVYAERALGIIWSSIINDNKEEVARLCNLLANIAVRMDEQTLAMRLGEKAQVFFGQLGMWRQWQNAESQLQQWSVAPPKRYEGEDYDSVSFDEIHHFLQCLEALNAQELIHKRISKLLDVRVYYVQVFARALNLSERDLEDLVLASRFADYGLTALENEVVIHPTRSQVAFEQYKQHPSLSVRMARMLHLSERITDIIEDHHEHFDGSGYPNGKQSEAISYLARILSIADKYSAGIVLEGKSHFEVLNEIVEQSGTIFDPEIARVFVQMYEGD